MKSKEILKSLTDVYSALLYASCHLLAPAECSVRSGNANMEYAAGAMNAANYSASRALKYFKAYNDPEYATRSFRHAADPTYPLDQL